MPENDIIYSNCCDNPVAFLTHSYDELYAPDCKDVKPHWVVMSLLTHQEIDGGRVWHYSFRDHARRECTATYCPNCGKKLPDVVKKQNPPENITNVTDGGYYCATCKERLNACTCALPHMAWEIKKG
jgi:hypothetical protein